MKPYRLQLVLLQLGASMIVSACDPSAAPLVPKFDPDSSILDGTVGLRTGADSLLSGRYAVEEGEDLLGNEVALLSHLGEASIFCRPDATYVILDAGRDGDRIALEGYWREGAGVETGLLRLQIAPDEGGREIATAGNSAASVILRGEYGTGGSSPDREIVLRRVGRLDAPPMAIIGHRGGGRNADRLPYSENSLELLRFAPRLGCNAVEIDIQLTSDDVPILFHDPEFSTRLIREEFLVGPVRNYSLRQIRQFATLRNGEKIPTLEEALRELEKIEGISLVWVDVKSAEALIASLPHINRVNRRNMNDPTGPHVFAGLPLSSVHDAYGEIEVDDRPPAICELSPDSVRQIGAEIWAPRWTLGLQTDQLEQIHAEGRRAFVWTVDMAEFIERFVNAGYDGILSNFPTLVAWYHYVGRGR